MGIKDFLSKKEEPVKRKFNRSVDNQENPQPVKKFNRIATIISTHNLESNDHLARIKTTGNIACFVCDKKFKKDQRKIFIGTMEGEKLYRHERCDCHSKKWHKKFHGCKTLINH